MRDDLAEQSVLSCCYQSPLALERAAAILTGTDFANPDHERLWDVLTGLRAEGKPTDAFAVQVALKGHQRLMSVHLQVTVLAVLPDTVEYHAATVHGLARRRDVVRQAIRMRQKAEDLEQDPQSLVAETVNELTRMRDLGAPDIETKTLGELMHTPDEPYDWQTELGHQVEPACVPDGRGVRPGVDEVVADSLGTDASAWSVTGLQDRDERAALLQPSRCREPGETGTDHDDLTLCHVSFARPPQPGGPG